jgi:hypothetical protein
MTFWLWLIAGIVVVFAAAVWLIDGWQDRKPTHVSASDWDRVSAEREREKFQRVMGKR